MRLSVTKHFNALTVLFLCVYKWYKWLCLLRRYWRARWLAAIVSKTALAETWASAKSCTRQRSCLRAFMLIHVSTSA